MASRLALSPSQLGSPAPLLPSSSSSSASSTGPRPVSERRDAGHLPRSCIGFSTPVGRAKRLAITTKAVEQAATASAIGGVVEVTQETFWPVVEAAGDKLVVLDMYTQWCGPCKIMYPKIVELSGKYTDVVFLKLDCNQANKALAKKLGVRVVPTFKLFKNRQEVAEVKGAKFDELLQSIEKARAS